MKLKDLIKEEGKKTISINNQSVEVVTYISVLQKEIMANEIIEYIFEVEKDSNNKITDVKPTYNKFLLEIVKTYMVVKNYLVGIDLDGYEDDYDKIHDTITKNGIMDSAIREIKDIKSFLMLLDNKIKQLIKLGNVNRQEDLLKSVDTLIDSFQTLNSNMNTKTALEIEKLEKEIDALPQTQDEIRMIAEAISKNNESINN